MVRLPKTYYDYVAKPDKFIQVHRGGSRSGKTYSIVMRIIELCSIAKNSKLTISIVRKTLPALKATVLRDFLELIKKYDLYTEANFNKTELTYQLNGNTVEFFSLDNEQKVRGRKRDVLYLNEANEVGYEDYMQLEVRTSEMVIMDFNPSEPNSWIRKHIETREDAAVFVSTYLDNPFVPERIKINLERRRLTDPDGFNIYGLGEYGSGSTVIYPKFEVQDFSHIKPDTYNTVIGIDYGFNDPTAIVQITRHDGCYYVKLIKYGSGLSTDTIAKTITENNLTDYTIYFDSASPGVINDLKQRFGIYCKAPRKEVMAGILWCKQQPLIVDSNSERLIEDLQNYSWEKDRNGNILDKPDNKLHEHSHTMDAMRYAMYTEWRRETE